jgi:hypothetical protein
MKLNTCGASSERAGDILVIRSEICSLVRQTDSSLLIALVVHSLTNSHAFNPATMAGITHFF